MGGTCVNRGCVPSKALLAVSGRMRELQSDHHLKALGLQVLVDPLDDSLYRNHDLIHTAPEKVNDMLMEEIT